MANFTPLKQNKQIQYIYDGWPQQNWFCFTNSSFLTLRFSVWDNLFKRRVSGDFTINFPSFFSPSNLPIMIHGTQIDIVKHFPIWLQISRDTRIRSLEDTAIFFAQNICEFETAKILCEQGSDLLQSWKKVQNLVTLPLIWN